ARHTLSPPTLFARHLCQTHVRSSDIISQTPLSESYAHISLKRKRPTSDLLFPPMWSADVVSQTPLCQTHAQFSDIVCQTPLCQTNAQSSLKSSLKGKRPNSD